jgi:hypothetical protein
MDVDRQIRQMADFIELEAKEKAAEIRAKVRRCSPALPRRLAAASGTLLEPASPSSLFSLSLSHPPLPL